jgi:hypothetical protein
VRDRNRYISGVLSISSAEPGTKAGSHKDDQLILESPDIAEMKTNCRKWLTSPKVFDILTLDIKCSNKKGKRRTPSDEKAGTDL